MNKYKIKVEFSRIYEIETGDNHEAQTKAQSQAVEEIEKLQDLYSGTDLTSRLFRVEEYQEPTDWCKEAEEDGNSLATDLEDVIVSAVNVYKKDNSEVNKAIAETKKKRKADKAYMGGNENVIDEIFDKLYQGEDINYKATEYADGQFIYNDRESIKEALDCINELSAFEETDSGLWEGMKSIEEQINARATYTYANAIYDSAERIIRERITELLGMNSNKGRTINIS